MSEFADIEFDKDEEKINQLLEKLEKLKIPIKYKSTSEKVRNIIRGGTMKNLDVIIEENSEYIMKMNQKIIVTKEGDIEINGATFTN